MERERFAWKCLLHALRPYGPPEVWQSSFGPDSETALSEEEQALLRRASGIVAGTAKLDISEGGLLSIFDLLDGGKPQAERGLQSAKAAFRRGKRRPVSVASHRYHYKRAMDFMDNFMQICFT